MSDLFGCGCERGGSCTRISACRASAVFAGALDDQRREFEAQIDGWRAELMKTHAELVVTAAALESLQNKWANRPLTVADTAALERENDALRAELARLADAGTGYSQQTVDAITKEREALRAELAEMQCAMPQYRKMRDEFENLRIERDQLRARLLDAARLLTAAESDLYRAMKEQQP